MRLLLDTCTLYWSGSEPEVLSRRSRAALTDGANEVLVSAASGWEIAIKHRLGRMELASTPERFVQGAIARTNLAALPITLAHALCAGSLPLHHRDPFDRMLVAQAQLEALTIVTPDAVFDRYGVSRLW